ncbi:MAG: cyclophilin-like family protein [Candidatus Hadarchaeum sp.]|uniref:cyclophilin-like family protein n=1 Tax=Candidatus Hadarchaeum sp. TaxID=2883567 RepID=UPI003175F52B
MSRKLILRLPEFEAEVELLEDEHPKICDAIWRVLPFDGVIDIWKEEIYFDIPVKIRPEKTTTRTKAGDVSYWPDGPAFCVFFGSSQPVGPVETFGVIRHGIENFRRLKAGDRITVTGSR